MHFIEIKKYLTMDMIIILLVNIFLADVSIISVYSLIYFTSGFFSGNPFVLSHFGLSLTMIFVIPFLRLLVLPFLYNYFEKFSKNDILVMFIRKIKTLNKLKIQILLLAYLLGIINFIIIRLPYGISILDDMVDIMYGGFLISVFYGLLGSYLVLYLYWYIEDKAKAYISKQNTLLSKTVILFKLMI